MSSLPYLQTSFLPSASTRFLFSMSGMWEEVNPGYMSAMGGQAEKSMRRGQREVGDIKAGIDGHLVSLLDRVGNQAISMETRGHHQVWMPEAAAGREVITFVLGIVRTPIWNHQMVGPTESLLIGQQCTCLSLPWLIYSMPGYFTHSFRDYL